MVDPDGTKEESQIETSSEDEPGRQPEAPNEAEVLEKLPEPEKQVVERFFGAAMSMGNPLAHKITSQHITDMLSIARDEASQGYADRRDSRRTIAIVGVVFLAGILGFAAILAFKEQNDLLLELLKDLGLLLGGSGLGYGAAGFRNRGH